MLKENIQEMKNVMIMLMRAMVKKIVEMINQGAKEIIKPTIKLVK